MIVYNKLWILLNEKGMKRSDLRQILNSTTVAKLGRNETVTTETIGKICDFLNCQPGDILENINSESLNKIANEFNRLQNVMVDSLKEQGVSEEEFTNVMGEMINRMFNGENVIQTELDKIKDKQEETDGTTENE